MYEKGELIVYGTEGACRVLSVGPSPFSGVPKDKLYYTLEPVYHTGVIYAPVDVKITMRKVLTRDEAWALINDIPNMEAETAVHGDPRQIVAEYKERIQSCDCRALLRLIRMIYAKNHESSRGLGQIDDRFIKRAKDLLYGELALALEIPYGEVEKTIIEAVEKCK